MNYFQNLKWRLKTFFSSPKRTYIFLAAVAVLAAGSALAYQTWPRDEETGEKKALIERSQYPVFSVYQDEKFRVMYYDFDAERTYELMSVDEKADNKYFLGADYSSAKNQIAYSNGEGLFVYDLATAKSTRVIEHKKTGSAEIPFSEVYMNPKWSPDGSKIAYKIGYYEGAGYGFMNADGSDAQTIEKGGYDFAWKKDSSGYALGSSVGLADGGLYVSQDPLRKVKEIIAGDEDADSISWLDGETILLSTGKSFADPPEKKYLIAIKASGTDRTTLEKDTYENDFPLADSDGSIYFAKFKNSSGDTDPGSGKGIYVTNLTNKESSVYYADGEKLLFPESVSSKHLVVRSLNSIRGGAALTQLMLVAKEDKKALGFAEANIIDFAGWLNSAKVPNGVKQSDTVTPTEEEKQAYLDSLKSKGYLSYTYYDYCWDYDCNTGVYPYDKKSSPFEPELVTVTTPLQLTGTVDVPLVYVYTNEKAPDLYLNAHKDASIQNSPAFFAAWVNARAKDAGQKLTFSITPETTQVKNPINCVNSQGSYSAFDGVCFAEELIKAIPSLASKKLWLIVNVICQPGQGSCQSQSVYNGADNSALQLNESNRLVTTAIYPSSTYDNAETIKKSMESNPISYTYAYQKILNGYGAKVKRVVFGSPKSGTLTDCTVDPAEEVMCATKFQDATQKVRNVLGLPSLALSEITKKELGWFDADGDKVNEVDDKCPYSKANSCKK